MMSFSILLLAACLQTSTAQPTERELLMLEEVNYARTKPAEYAQYIAEYVEYWQSTGDELAASKELYKILTTMEPIQPLVWADQLYADAVKHGNWMKRTGNFEHSDYDWAENLVCGEEEIRYSVLNLLIDGGVRSRGHRKNLLSPEYKEFAAFEVPGEIDGCSYTFVQEFN